MSAHVMSFEEGAVLADTEWQAPAYCFDEQNEENVVKQKLRIDVEDASSTRFFSSLEASMGTLSSCVMLNQSNSPITS